MFTTHFNVKILHFFTVNLCVSYDPQSKQLPLTGWSYQNVYFLTRNSFSILGLFFEGTFQIKCMPSRGINLWSRLLPAFPKNSFPINFMTGYPLGTVRPLYRTGVSVLSRERF